MLVSIGCSAPIPSQRDTSIPYHEPLAVHNGQSRFAVPPPRVPTIIMKQYLIRRARKFIPAIRRSACHIPSNIIWRVPYTHDAVPDDAKVMSLGFAQRMWWGRKLTTTMNSGTVRKSRNVAHFRMRSFCQTISISGCLVDRAVDMPFLLCQSFELTAGESQYG